MSQVHTEANFRVGGPDLQVVLRPIRQHPLHPGNGSGDKTPSPHPTDIDNPSMNSSPGSFSSSRGAIFSLADRLPAPRMT